MLLPTAMLNQYMIAEVGKCNDYTAKYGLSLSDAEIHELVSQRKEALNSSGRIEFGGGVIQKIIMEFMDSPYLLQDDYLETLEQLQEIFYYFKNESMDELSDDELLHLMKKYFDDVCQGSLEYLNSTMLENYCRDIRYGAEDYRNMGGYEDNYEDFLDMDTDEFY